MAYCITPQWVANSPQAKLTVTQSAETSTTVTLSYTLQYIASYAASCSDDRAYSITINGTKVKSGTYPINGKTGTHTVATGTVSVNKTTATQTISFSVSFTMNLTWSSVWGGVKSASGSISVAAKTSYTVSYNANGGSGAPSAQTKWAGTAITLSNTKPTRTGYTFAGWATSASGNVAYAAGANYTADSNATLYAKWTAITYTVSYNANGGSGAPSAQTKTYGVDLTLSSTKPTRTNYTFKGWGVSTSSTTVSYAAGAKYTSNADITLYAIWELAYTKPRITNVKTIRCDSSGNASDDGKYGKATFSWATDKTVSSIKIEWTSSGGSGSKTVSASGTSNSVSQIFGDNALSLEHTYEISITVADGSGTAYSTTVYSTIRAMALTFDALPRHKGVAFGKPATIENGAEFAYDIYDKHGQQVTNGLSLYTGSGTAAIDPNTTLDHIILTNKNVPVSGSFFYIETIFYSTKSTTANRVQIAYPYNAYKSIYYRFYYDGAWDNWRDPCNLVTCSRIGAAPSAHNHMNESINPSSVELYGNSSHGGYIDFHYNDNSKDYTHRIIASGTTLLLDDASGGGINLQSRGSIRFYGTGSSTFVAVLNDRMRPSANDTYYLGATDYKWKSVFAVTGTIQTSDRNTKKDISELSEKYVALFEKLIPVSFMFNDAESDRTHIGFISQDVKAAMDEVGLTDLDFAGFCRDIKTEWDEETQTDKEVFDENGNPVYVYSLRYSEFIALNSKMIQLTRQQLDEQKNEIESLKNDVEYLKNAIKKLTSDGM